MSFLEAVRLAIESIWANRLRSFLTLLGVIIGIAAIVSTWSVIQGLNAYVSEKLSNLGKGVFVVQRFGIITNRQQFLDAARKNRKLEPADARAIAERCPSAAAVAYEVHATVDLRRDRYELRDVDVGGITWRLLEIEPFEVADGRILAEHEEQSGAPVCFVGHDIAERLFPGLDPIGKELRVKGVPLQVVGVAVKKGSLLGVSQDNYLKIPFALHRKLFGSQRSINISVQAADAERMDVAMDEVRGVLRARHHLQPRDADDFDFLTADGINSLWATLTGTIFAVAMFVVGISLVVGGIVIMNIMLVSVTERTREIGIRKSLGARRSDILMQILIESVIMASAGGFLGVAIGATMTTILTVALGVTLKVSPFYVLLSVLVSGGVGVASGWYPASKASKLDPIVALRAE